MAERCQVRVDGLPRKLRNALIADHRSSGQSVNHIVVGVIAKYYDFPYNGAGGTGRKPKLPGRLVLKVPHDLWITMRLDVAATPGLTLRKLVIDLLNKHYG